MLSLCARSERSRGKYTRMTSVYHGEVREVAWRHWRASPPISTLHEHKSGARPQGSVAVLRMVGAGAACAARPLTSETAPARGAPRLAPMDVLPMRPGTGGAGYRAIGGEPTRRIERILLSFRPWSLTCR